MGLPEVLGVIPARAGSKRVPGKNLRPLLGEPLLAYAIRASLAAASVARTIVSTDGEEIARVAESYGAEVVVRPPELASDESPTEDALLHVIETLEARGEAVPELVATLEPTSPLRTPEVVDAAAALAVERGADAVIAVAETRDLFGRMEGDRFTYLEPGHRRRRQDRRPLYRESGTVYLTRTAWLREHRSVIGGRLHALVVPEELAVDVNTPFDLVVAEAALAAVRAGKFRG